MASMIARRFRDTSIKRKLIVLMLVITSVSLVLSGASYIALDYLSARERFVDKIQTLSKVIATNVAAPLLFGDADAAKETLQSVAVVESVTDVFVHTLKGKLLVQYHRGKVVHSHIDHSHAVSKGPVDRLWSIGSLGVFAPIVVDGRKVGAVHIVASLRELRAGIVRSLVIGLLLTVVLIAVAVLMATMGHGLITRPILRLTDEMRLVTREQDYSVRVEKTSQDELGELVDGFNGMLSAIDRRDMELASYREGLKELVSDRTEELKTRNDELTRAITAAEAANLAKSQFLANMSHEIRTPMNGVLGMADLLGGCALDQRQRRYLDTIKTSGESLLTVVNDILDFSKSEAGHLELHVEPFDLHQMVEDVAALLAPAARTKKLELMALVGDDVPLRVVGDRARLRQILTNLLGNAVKFTEAGEVFLSVRLVEGPTNFLSFEVHDTGIGIAADQRENLFDPFQQADNTAARRFGGTGLGLAITRQLVEKMGGKVQVESAPGKGSRFWFDIQLAGAAGEMPTTATAGGPFNVLVVDDNATARDVVETYIGRWGWPVRAAASGEDAIVQVAAAESSGDGFDLVILDIMMPGLDGIAVANRIWSQPETADLPVIFMTAVDESNVSGDLPEHGRSLHLAKPIRQGELHDIVVKLMTGASVTAASPRSMSREAETPPFLSRCVLLAEDNPINQEVSREHLMALGFQVDLAEDGAEAIQAFERREFDVILMDCQMPGIDGFEAARRIRELEARSPNRPRTPIVALTAHAMESDREECLAAGMDDYLSKPFRPGDLGETVARWVEPGSIVIAAPDSPDEAPDTAGPGDGPDDGPALNQSALDQLRSLRRDGAPDPVKRIVGLYLEKMPGELSTLGEAADAGDADALRTLAHKLKSGSASVGADALSRMFAYLEAAAKTGRLDGSAQSVSDIAREFERVNSALKKIA